MILTDGEIRFYSWKKYKFVFIFAEVILFLRKGLNKILFFLSRYYTQFFFIPVINIERWKFYLFQLENTTLYFPRNKTIIHYPSSEGPQFSKNHAASNIFPRNKYDASFPRESKWGPRVSESCPFYDLTKK